MSKRSSVPEEEKEFKVSKDRIAIMLNGNAAADSNSLKLFLKYRAESSRSFKSVNNAKLPIIQKFDSKAFFAAST